jgi:hypothetical protein
MCRPKVSSGASHVAYFDDSTKCCTYQPKLPNFLVGAMLEDDSAAFAPGRASIEKRIDEREGVTPLALERPWTFDLLYREVAKNTDAFGRTPALRCPHYSAATGGCSIWAYREATCSTWFCKHERGALGRDFWNALKLVFRLLEQALARHAVLQVGIGPEAMARLFDRPAEPAPTPRGLWGDWERRERAFYRATWAVARDVPFAELRALGGVELEVHLRLLADAHARLEDPRLPHHLERRTLHVLPTSADTCQVTTYRIYDPIELPTALVDALHRFDGRPTAEVVAELRREDGVVLDHDTLRQLVDFEVVAPEPR